MIAAVQISVVLDRQCPSAASAKDAQTWFHPHPGRECLIENLHEDSPDVSGHPFLEDFDQELSVLFREDTARADQVRLDAEKPGFSIC